MIYRRLLPTAALLVAAAIAGACSQNAGFSSPPVPGPPVPANNPNIAVGPSGSPGASGVPQTSGSPAAASQVLTVVSATGRFAYDGADNDPMRAPRLIELAFALKNPTTKAVTISKLTATGENNTAVGDSKLSVTIAPGATSDVTLIAFRPKKEAAYVKTVTMTFADDKGAALAVGSADLPPSDLPFVPLDEKDAKGGVTVDGVEISSVQLAGSGPHYEVTFAMTNAGTTKADLSGFSIVPPKTNGAKVNISLTIPPRNTTGFISIILPFKGKTLPDGDYTVNAVNGSATVAKASGALL
jgi:hypothetical protein